MAKDVAIKVDNLVKTFKIPVEAHSGIKQKIINQIKGRSGYRDFTPLKGVSFEIKKGEFFGIVGRNGSGKSTLLKTIAGIYHPDGGGVVVNGVLVPFIELGVGFNPELTGRENVFLNGALLGFDRSEMEKMYDEIVDFAELHEFMEEKLKNYSSGMQVRLAFSIAIRAKGDVLLLDEVLAVGDASFQQKCFDYFAELKKNNQTVVLVTHSMSNVRNFCERAILIDKGSVIHEGSGDDIADKYDDMFITESLSTKQSSEDADTHYPIRVESIQVIQYDKTTQEVNATASFTVRLIVHSDADSGEGAVAFNLSDSRDNIVFSTTSRNFEDNVVHRKGSTTYDFEVQNIFTNGQYYISPALGSGDKVNGKLVYKKPKQGQFLIKGFRHSTHSMTHPRVEFKQLT